MLPGEYGAADMTSDAYRNALRRRAELLKEIKEIDGFLEMYRRYSGTKVGETETLFGQGSIALDQSTSVVPDAVEPAPTRKKRRGNPDVIASAVERIIRDSGHPMVRSAIAEALEARGIEIPSNDKARYVGTVLWRQSDRFVNLNKEGYWIKGVPHEDAGYDPELEKRVEERVEEELQAIGDDAAAEGLV